MYVTFSCSMYAWCMRNPRSDDERVRSCESPGRLTDLGIAIAVSAPQSNAKLDEKMRVVSVESVYRFCLVVKGEAGQ